MFCLLLANNTAQGGSSIISFAVCALQNAPSSCRHLAFHLDLGIRKGLIYSKGRNSEADYDATARRLLVAHLQRKQGSHSVIKPVTLESCDRLDQVGLDCLCRCAVLCCCLLADKTRLHFYCHWALTPSLSRRKRWTFVYQPDTPPHAEHVQCGQGHGRC